MAKVKITISEMRNLVNGVEAGIERLTEAKREVSAGLSRFDINHSLGPHVQAAIDWGETELPGVRRRLSLAEALEETRPAGFPAGTSEIEENDISTVPPDQAQQDGADAAQALIDSHGQIPADLIAQIEANKHDPYFAAGLAENISPEMMAGLLSTYDTLGESGYVDEFDSNRKDLVVGLGTVFGTATRNTGDLAMPDDYADQWSNAITAKSTMEGGDAPQNQSQYLALLMQQGVYARPFLNDVGDAIYEYEAEGENGAVWGPKSANMDPVLDLEGNPVVDVMASFMVSLQNNPLAAQDFFSEGPTETMEINGQQSTVNSRLQYLIQERTWSHNADMSNGGHFGSALEAATTVYRDGSYTGATSAEIAGQTFALIGEQTRTDDGWKMWNGMRPHIANMLGNYSPDLLRIASRDGGRPDSGFGEQWATAPDTNLYGDGAWHGAAMDPKLIQEILGTLGENGNEEHLNVVLAGIGAASQWRMSDALDSSMGDMTDPPAPIAMMNGGNVPRLATASNEMATAMGWVLNSAYQGAMSEEELEAKRAKMMGQIFGAITSLPGVGPTAKFSKFVFDQVTGHIKNEISSTSPTSSAEFAQRADTQLEMLDWLVLDQMAEHGYMDPKWVEMVNGGGDRYQNVPPGLVTGNPPRFDYANWSEAQWDAYDAWRADRFPYDGFLTTHIHGPFNEALEEGLALARRK